MSNEITVPPTPRPLDEPWRSNVVEQNCRIKLCEYCDVHGITGHPANIIVGTLSTFTTDTERENYTNNVIIQEPPTGEDYDANSNDDYSMTALKT